MDVTAVNGVPAASPVVPRPASARLPGEWTFWADTIVGGQPLGTVQPSRFLCARELSKFPAGEVTLPVATTALPRSRLLRLWSWRLWAFYEGRPYWCGVPTGLRDESAAVVTLTLRELPGYLMKRQWDLGPPNTRFDQEEQCEIARQIAQPLQAVGVGTVTQPDTPVYRDREYAYLESDSRYQLLTNLSEVISGPQFRSEYGMDGDLPRCTVRIGYPQVGNPASGLGLIVPGNATAHTASWDSDLLRTRTFAVGESQEDTGGQEEKPVAVRDRPQPDLPRLDAVDDWPGVKLVSTLEERADTASAQYADPVLELTASGALSDPVLHSYAPGDTVTVRAVTPLLPGGLEFTGQLTRVYVNAMEQRCDWEVAMSLPPPKPRETLDERLDRIDLMTRAAFRRGLRPLT